MRTGERVRAILFGSFRRIAARLGGRGHGLAQVPGLMRVYGFLYRRLRPSDIVLTRVRDQQMYVRPEGSHLAASLLTTGTWENRETEIFAAAIEPGMTVLDLGANIGYYTLIAAKLVGPSGRVYAFEPDPQNHELLVRNVAVNGHHNVLVIAAAVAAATTRATLFIDDGHWGESLSAANISGNASAMEVDVVSLDDLMNNGTLASPVGLMKIDVQGAEGLVLQGGRALFTRDLPSVLMELEPERLRNMGTDPLALLEEFQAMGYRIQPIDERAGFDDPISLETMVSLADASGIINVFLSRRRPAVSL